MIQFRYIDHSEPITHIGFSYSKYNGTYPSYELALERVR